ncbi:MAG: hypothetical protein U0804_13520 [Gemmataceae bacterium]
MNLPRLALALLLGAAGVAPAAADEAPPAVKWYEVKDGKVKVNLYLFYSRTCPHCTAARTFLDGLQKRHDWLAVTAYETSGSPANMDHYRRMAAGLGKQAGQVPAFFYCKQMEIGYLGDDTTGKRLEAALVYYRTALQKQVDDRRPPPPPPAPPPPTAVPLMLLLVAAPPDGVPAPEPDLDLPLDLDVPPPPGAATVDVPWWGAVRPEEVSLPALTVVLGGLDSFNPCAFFVLLILLGLMFRTGSRSRMLLVGCVFVAVSGLVYFLFMAAWLNLFFMVGHLRVITLTAGAVATAVAVVNIKDYFWFKQGVTLSLSDSARSRLVHRMTAVGGANGLPALVVGTAALAFAANAYELLCTAGFPLVYTRVLTLRDLPPAGYYGYLALYNLVYVLPLFLIVVGFSVTLSSHKLTEYQGRVLKLLSGMLMLALGVVLLTDPELLSNLFGAAATLATAIGGTAAVVLGHRVVVRVRRAAALRPSSRTTPAG